MAVSICFAVRTRTEWFWGEGGERRERSEARWGGAHEPIILGAVLIGRYWVEEEGGWEWWSWV